MRYFRAKDALLRSQNPNPAQHAQLQVALRVERAGFLLHTLHFSQFVLYYSTPQAKYVVGLEISALDRVEFHGVFVDYLVESPCRSTPPRLRSTHRNIERTPHLYEYRTTPCFIPHLSPLTASRVVFSSQPYPLVNAATAFQFLATIIVSVALVVVAIAAFTSPPSTGRLGLALGVMLAVFTFFQMIAFSLMAAVVAECESVLRFCILTDACFFSGIA